MLLIQLDPIKKFDQDGQQTGWALCFPDEKAVLIEIMGQDLEPFEPDSTTPTFH